MCGIVGRLAFDPHEIVRPEEVRRLNDRIIHRGPDDEGLYVCGSVGLGVRRLKVIDPEGGHQPMTTPDGNITVVFNGEIYNYRELRTELEGRGHRFRTKSDTECVLYAYAEYGPACLARFNGMFAIAVWDKQRQRLMLARDRLGIKPLYYSDDGKSIRFASESQALLADPGVPRELDSEALAYYLRYGYVAAPATLVRAVRKLPPAHFMLVERGEISIRPFWELAHEVEPLPEKVYVERVHDLTRRAVERQLVSDVPLGAFLSGGLDSSSIVRLMTDLTGGPVNTYSIGFEGADRFHNELPDASLIAAFCKTNHHEILVRADVGTMLPLLVDRLDHPIADSSFIVTHLVARLARETVTVILSGVGGDELFGGYRRYLGPVLKRYYERVPVHARELVSSLATRLKVDRGSSFRNSVRLARGFVTSYHLPPFEQYDHAVRMASEERVSALMRGAPGADSELQSHRRRLFERVSDRDPIGQMMHLDLGTSLPESLLHLTDSMTMATSLEARVPLLDHELVELCARLPSSLKIHGTQLRYIQKRSMAQHLPPEVFKKRKWGFGCPIGRWFRHELNDLLRDTLSESRVRRKGLFDPRTITELVDAHLSCHEDNADLLLGLVTFDLWHSRWMD